MKTLYSVAIGPVIASALTVAVATQSKHLIRATESMGVQPKSFLVKGTKTATLNNRKFRFEIGGELPDKFLWKEELGVRAFFLEGSMGETSSLTVRLPFQLANRNPAFPLMIRLAWRS